MKQLQWIPIIVWINYGYTYSVDKKVTYNFVYLAFSAVCKEKSFEW